MNYFDMQLEMLGKLNEAHNQLLSMRRKLFRCFVVGIVLTPINAFLTGVRAVEGRWGSFTIDAIATALSVATIYFSAKTLMKMTESLTTVDFHRGSAEMMLSVLSPFSSEQVEQRRAN